MRSRFRKSKAGDVRSDSGSDRRSARDACGDRRSNSEETLASLLKQVTRNRRHEEVDWGPPVGKEVW